VFHDRVMKIPRRNKLRIKRKKKII
jgi:hypothetical protein